MPSSTGSRFYNAGRVAGASQARKHLQLVPLPLAPEVPAPTPLEPLITRGAAAVPACVCAAA